MAITNFFLIDTERQIFFLLSKFAEYWGGGRTSHPNVFIFPCVCWTADIENEGDYILDDYILDNILKNQI